MHAFAIAWIVCSSVWTSFCIFDGFRTWMRFRRWKATVAKCEIESAALLLVLVREIGKAYERIRSDSRPGNVGPEWNKP